MHAVSAVRSMESAHRPTVILRCKLIVLGDPCVGKTALTQVFHSGGSTYPKNYLMTTGAEFCVKQVAIPETNTIGFLAPFIEFTNSIVLINRIHFAL
jgi:GTPase SAR1 family protein